MIGYSSKHLSNVDIVSETYKQTKILECFLKISSTYWSKLLEINDYQYPSTPLTKHQIGTPILLRHNHISSSPTPTYSAPSNTFFSPI